MLRTKKRNIFSKPIIQDIQLLISLLAVPLCEQTPIKHSWSLPFSPHYKAGSLSSCLWICAQCTWWWLTLSLQQTLNKYPLVILIQMVSIIFTSQWVLIVSPTSSGALLIWGLLPQGKRNLVHSSLLQHADAQFTFTYREIITLFLST